MKKDFAPRFSTDPIWYDDICECGHGWEDHPLNWYFVRGKCDKCMCPKYKLDIDNPSELRKSYSDQQKVGSVE